MSNIERGKMQLLKALRAVRRATFFYHFGSSFSSLGSLMASKKCTFQLPEHTWAPKMLHEAPAPLSPHPFGLHLGTLNILKKRRGRVFEGVQKWIQK